jgi:hypothetical protein
MKIVVFATHSEGYFDQLMQSGYHIEVLGWGTKWEGYMGKCKKVLEYLYQQKDDEIVISIDGFDSKINKNLDGLEEAFKRLNCNILVSDNERKNANVIEKYNTRKIFGSCKNKTTLNAGMYMGYAINLRVFLEKIISLGIKDDQRAMNILCDTIPNLKADTETIIFENMIPGSGYSSNAYFVSYPGMPSFNRSLRAIPEYSEYFIPEIVGFCIVLFIIYHFSLRVFARKF